LYIQHLPPAIPLLIQYTFIWWQECHQFTKSRELPPKVPAMSITKQEDILMNSSSLAAFATLIKLIEDLLIPTGHLVLSNGLPLPPAYRVEGGAARVLRMKQTASTPQWDKCSTVIHCGACSRHFILSKSAPSHAFIKTPAYYCSTSISELFRPSLLTATNDCGLWILPPFAENCNYPTIRLIGLL